MALWRIGNQADARESYQVAAKKLDAMKSRPERLVRLRAEAAALLGAKEEPAQPNKDTPVPKP